jgi:hypothetical protein
MIIDCHGHYTTAPQALTDFRDAQVAALKDPAQTPSRASLKISDDQIRDSLEKAQLKLQRDPPAWSGRRSATTSSSAWSGCIRRISSACACCRSPRVLPWRAA